MINLTQGQTSQSFVVTLNEKKTLSEAYYLFVFTNITTRDEVKFCLHESADESDYPTRYNEFTINTSSYFDDYNTGEWHYKVYESATSTTDSNGLTEVERGKMTLKPATEFSYTKYDEATTFKAYNG